MRIILTEEQLNLIKEHENYSDRIIETTTSLKDNCNKLYRVLTFTTIAELRDMDTDIGTIIEKLDRLITIKNGVKVKLTDFEKRNGEDPSSKELFEDMKVSLINVEGKLSALGEIVKGLEVSSDPTFHELFKDIKPLTL